MSPGCGVGIYTVVSSVELHVGSVELHSEGGP